MTPNELTTFLHRLVADRLLLSAMIWGPPGIGKSSIVAQVAQAAGIACVDVRLSQLAPTDLRGLPVPEGGVSRWYPPEFLPRDGAGILFLDELNMAPPTMQGMAQQLILDRRVGSYVVPPGWFIWAAGNRKEDFASVYDMPAPLANRFLHLSVQPDFTSFKSFALDHGIHERALAFLSFRPELLHKANRAEPAWPSPRSWMMASDLYRAGLDIAPAVGEAVAAEFAAYPTIYANLPNLEAILAGQGAQVGFPKEPSVRYATIIGLQVRGRELDQAIAALKWLAAKASAEWLQLYIHDFMRLIQAKNYTGRLATLSQTDPALKRVLDLYLRDMAQ